MHSVVKMANLPFFSPSLYPDNKPEDHPHPGELVYCLYLGLQEVLHKERKATGVWLGRSKWWFHLKKGLLAPQQTYKQTGWSGEVDKSWCRLLVSLKKGRWLGIWFQLAGEWFQVWVVFSSWTGRIGCDEQESVAWGLSCSSRQGPGGGLPYGSCSVKYIQAIISIASWEKVKIKAP